MSSPSAFAGQKPIAARAVNHFSLTMQVEHLARIVIERARGLADLGVVEDRGEAPGQLPGLEERRPVDVASTSSARS